MNRPEDLDLLKDALLARPRAETPTPECLDDETVAAFAEGALDGSARRAVLPHLAECSQCRGAVASVARALADSAMAREVAAVEGG
ncbi:MAG: zf-HC2 domain-containing protein, partial [Gemmatimonadales bacterium]|nr:zf-HC2 domain-containing protein [Gemmatimonadales bacterium]